MKYISRGEAIKLGEKTYFTGEPCIKGHISPKYTKGSTCVSCAKERSRDNRLNNSDKVKTYMKEYISKNSDKISEYKSEWRSLNPEKIRMYQRKYAKKNPDKSNKRVRRRRALKNNAEGFHEASDILEILKMQWYRCAEPTCMSDLKIAGYHVDHIMPLTLGGSDWPDNLQCLCPSCNLSKGSKHPDDWDIQNGRH